MTNEDRFWVGPAAAPDTYQLVTCLGGGAEGEVWTAVLPLSAEGRRNVAVKILPSSPDGADEAAWINHGHLLRSIAHPGLVRVIEAFTGPVKHRGGEAGPAAARYVVMDLVEGVTLREWLEDNPTASASKRLRTLITVAAALDEMHSGAQTAVPVAHGDVKPSNIVIRPDGSTVLVDLGLTRLADGGGRVGRSRPYAAPELFAPGAISTPEADRFAFAATVVHAFLGEPAPVTATGGPDLAAVDARLRSDPLTARRPMLIDNLMRALAVPPEQRPASLRTWLTALTDTLSQITGSGEPARPAGFTPFDQAATEADGFRPPVPPTQTLPVAVPVTRSRGRGKLIAIAALVLVVLVGGGVAYAALGHKTAKTPTANGPTGVAGATSGAPSPSDTPSETPSIDEPSGDPSGDPSGLPSTDPSGDPSTDASATPGNGLPTGPSGPVIQYLADVDQVVRGYDTGTQKVDASIYTHSLYSNNCHNCYSADGQFDLSRNWTTFRAVVGVNDDSDPSVVLQFEIFADGKRVGKAVRMHLGQHQAVSVSIAGALRLKLVISWVSGDGGATGVWGDAEVDR